jgi:hypothetical protein
MLTPFVVSLLQFYLFIYFVRRNMADSLDYVALLAQLKTFFTNSRGKEGAGASNDDDAKICRFELPDELTKLVDVDCSKKFKDDDDYITAMKNVAKYSVNTNHRLFFNQLFVNSDLHVALSDLMVSLLNASMYTYEMSPVFTLMEENIFSRILSLFSFEGGVAFGSPGGMWSNVQAMHLARYALDSKLTHTGMYGQKPMRAYVSADAHYSFKKGHQLLGMGDDNIIKVPTDARGRMDCAALEALVAADAASSEVTPYIVVATAGTTVLGAYDDFHGVSAVCKKHNLWMHIDGVSYMRSFSICV